METGAKNVETVYLLFKNSLPFNYIYWERVHCTQKSFQSEHKKKKTPFEIKMMTGTNLYLFLGTLSTSATRSWTEKKRKKYYFFHLYLLCKKKDFEHSKHFLQSTPTILLFINLLPFSPNQTSMQTWATFFRFPLRKRKVVFSFSPFLCLSHSFFLLLELFCSCTVCTTPPITNCSSFCKEDVSSTNSSWMAEHLQAHIICTSFSLFFPFLQFPVQNVYILRKTKLTFSFDTLHTRSRSRSEEAV